MGRYLDLADQVIKQGVHVPTHPVELAAFQRETSTAIPSSAILLARSYDGGNRPLASVPKCWCCKAPYQLEWLQEWKGKIYVWLEPGCDCLETGMCYACFVCREHCQCTAKTGRDSLPKTSAEDFRTPQGDGGSR